MITNAISFNDVHSYKDLNLILTTLYIPPAIPKTNYLSIPGGDGFLDLTEAFGGVRYHERDCKFTFLVYPGDDFEKKKTEVSNVLSGKKCKIVLDDDAAYYYYGRCEVNGYLLNGKIRQIIVTAKVQPYKYKQDQTVVEVTLTGEIQEVILTNGRKSVVPEITCTSDNTVVVYGAIEKTLSAGTHKILDIQLKEGENVMNVSGSGTLTIKYREGEL